MHAFHSYPIGSMYGISLHLLKTSTIHGFVNIPFPWIRNGYEKMHTHFLFTKKKHWKSEFQESRRIAFTLDKKILQVSMVKRRCMKSGSMNNPIYRSMGRIVYLHLWMLDLFKSSSR